MLFTNFIMSECIEIFVQRVFSVLRYIVMYRIRRIIGESNI